MEQRQRYKRPPPDLRDGEADPFVIIHDHRKAKKLKKMREVRRKKLKAKSEQVRLRTQAQRKEKLTKINRSMLLDEDDWSNVRSLIVAEESQVSIDEEVALDNRIQNLCWQVLYILPASARRFIFADEFSSFSYEC